MSYRNVRDVTDEDRAELKVHEAPADRARGDAGPYLASERPGTFGPQVADLHDRATRWCISGWSASTRRILLFSNRDREGRPRKFSDKAEQEIEKLLESDPNEYGKDATR